MKILPAHWTYIDIIMYACFCDYNINFNSKVIDAVNQNLFLMCTSIMLDEGGVS